MAYISLYRAYRPINFSDVVGQDHIVGVLKNQIANQRISHAYLFSGPRGTGKTSCAKIFAKAINCKNLINVTPCEQCEICQSVASDNCVDIIEIDAASNNGVDNIRDIREKAALLPASAKYKVYIIDEVHMLSSGAFNALLKTLEEPPSHVVFILATTEPKKIPATIHSRCQKFDFKRLSVDDIVSRLNHVAQKQNIQVDQEALVTIARSALGGMRDALSILDQCTSDDTLLTADIVIEILGGASRKEVLELLQTITSYDEKNAIIKLESIKDSGADVQVLYKDLTLYFKSMLFLVKGASPIAAGVLNQDKEKLLEMGQNFGEKSLARALDIFVENEKFIATNSMPDLILQLCIIKIMNLYVDEKTEYSQRIDQLESKLEQLKKNGIKTEHLEITNSIDKQMENKPELTKTQVSQTKQKTHITTVTKKIDADTKKLWETVLGMINVKSAGLYPHAAKLMPVEIIDDKLIFQTKNKISYNYIKQNKEKFLEYVHIVFEKITNAEFILDQKDKVSEQKSVLPEDLFGDMDIKEI